MSAASETPHGETDAGQDLDIDPRHVHGHDGGHGSGAAHGTFKGYVIGFLLSVVLTAIPFWLVMDKVFADPQVEHLALTLPVMHETLGTLALIRPPMQIDGVQPRHRPTPERGEHTNAVLQEFGFTEAEIAALAEQGVI